MRRRRFVAGLGVAAVWPVVARAQQRALPVIVFVDIGSGRGARLEMWLQFRKGPPRRVVVRAER
jgi:hypothetical protein